MKKIALFSVLFLLPLFASAQSAKVIALSSADAKEAKSLYEQQAEIQKKIDTLQKKIQSSYLSDSSKGGYKSFGFLDGWESGFEFSDNFLFIVPRQSSVIHAAPCPSCAVWSGVAPLFNPVASW